MSASFCLSCHLEVYSAVIGKIWFIVSLEFAIAQWTCSLSMFQSADVSASCAARVWVPDSKTWLGRIVGSIDAGYPVCLSIQGRLLLCSREPSAIHTII